MPLTRYRIRNEYGLADPEVYRGGDKDDPEELLEGVAMAGLVGVLRQLGDLAEFAAEIFHDLHEEVMATAARGHGLMARVQQLEAEFPSIEKALLLQTDHSAFYTNSGIDWHPNLYSEQGLITRGDLPRFVMDSYEESRGPPRLFLLDKFDVAGAGACLKRYTDPSFFKLEAAVSGISNVEIQREKKIRKVKKKGSRWKNGDTPEVAPSHPKLHDLLLEERFENGHPDPARLVKLKRRQLHGSPFDARAGRSYMKKFIGTPSPENKAVCEVSVNPPLLKLTSDYSSESGLEVHEISMVSPEKNWSPERERNLLSPSSEKVMLKPVTNELDLDVIDKGAITVCDQSADGGETNVSPTAIHTMAIEEDVAVDDNGKLEGSLDGDHSDGMISEIDNYMDALTTMETEIETDNEYKYRNDRRVLKMESDANEEQLDAQANFSDCQSIENFSLSDDGNSSYKKQKSISSYSSSLVNSADIALSDGEGGGKVASTDNFPALGSDLLSHYPSECVESTGTECLKLAESNGTGMDEWKISDKGEASVSVYPVDSNCMLQPSVPVEVEEIPVDSVASGSTSIDAVKTVTDLDDSSVKMSNITVQTSNGPTSAVVHESDHEDLCMPSDIYGHAPNVLELDSERRGSNGSMNEETSLKENVEACTISQVDCADVAQDAELISEIDDSISGKSLTSMEDHPETDITKEDQSSAVMDKFSQDEVDSIRMKPEVSGVAGVDYCRSTDDAVETALSEDGAASTVVFSGTKDGSIDDVTYPVLDMTSQNLTEEWESIRGPMDPQPKLFGSHEAAAPDCHIESEASEEVKQEDFSWKDLDPVPSFSISNNHANAEANKQICDSVLDKYHQADPLFSDAIVEPCLEQSEEFKSYSAVQGYENDLSSPSYDVLDAETSLNEPMVEVDEISVQVEDPSPNEGKCNPLDLQSSPNVVLAKPQILFEQISDAKYESPDRYLEAVEAHAQSSNSLTEQMPSLRHMDNEIYVDTSRPDDVSSQKDTLQSPGLEHDTKQTSNPFDSAFPGFGLMPQATEVNLEMPPLPPLPPMQWRMSKFQFTPEPSEKESVGQSHSKSALMQPFAYDEKVQFTSEHGHATFPPTQTCTPDDKDQFEFPMSDTEKMQLSNPFLSAKSTDNGRLQAFSENTVQSCVHPTPISQAMPAFICNVSGQQELGPSAETETSNPFLAATELPPKNPEDSSYASLGVSVLSNSTADSSQNDTASGQEGLLHEPPISTLEQSNHETGSERTLPEHSSECSEKERDSPDKCVESVSTAEEYKHDLVSSKGESTWYPVTSLSLPPSYEAGKQNGNKLPRPRNPLIDAVAAHDKSKLRKVAERVQPQVGPKVEERDSLLEQIRTKSFNLKPATVTRPSIQGIHGPNLKVAAILEKANAIRQAMAGSDEDEDSDSWSDS